MCTVTELDVSNAQVGTSLESINTSEIVHDAVMTDGMSLIGLQKNDKPEKVKGQQTENLVNCEVQCEMNLTDPPNHQDDLNLQDQSKGVQFQEKTEAKNATIKGPGVKQTITMLGYVFFFN
jgi:hypothetical protein